VGVACELVEQPQRGVARALRMVLMRDRRAEKRHDAVAGVLVDAAFVAMHAGRQQLEELVHDPVPGLGIDGLGERHRLLDVGEQHRDLLAFALDDSALAQDLLGEMPWCVRIRGRGRGLAGGMPAAGAELRTEGERGVAVRAAKGERRAAFLAEFGRRRVFEATLRALHGYALAAGGAFSACRAGKTIAAVTHTAATTVAAATTSVGRCGNGVTARNAERPSPRTAATGVHALRLRTR